MQIFELYAVSNNPKRNDFHYAEYRVYNNSLYMEAECNVDCKYNADEEFTDEEYNRLVELELKGIMQTLERHGRYPINGIPRFVAY